MKSIFITLAIFLFAWRNALYKDYVKNRDKGWRLETSKGSISRKWEKDTTPLTP